MAAPSEPIGVDKPSRDDPPEGRENMDDDQHILAAIADLVDEEHALRNATSGDRDQQRLRSIEIELDRCWDLLRQRRAPRTPGADRSGIAARDADVVESYLQ